MSGKHFTLIQSFSHLTTAAASDGTVRFFYLSAALSSNTLDPVTEPTPI